MSVFETYDETSRHYDKTRVAIGGEILLGCLARHAKPLHELRVLDAGCGTGAYSQVLIGRVGHVEALDMSAGMLERARAKLAAEAEAGRIRFHQGSIAALPLAAGSVDAVTINQVVQHLGDTPEDGFPRLRQVVAEFARVLRPGGVLAFNHCSQTQMRDAFWYYHLCPEGHETIRRRFVPFEVLRASITSTDIAGTTFFCASGTPAPAAAPWFSPPFTPWHSSGRAHRSTARSVSDPSSARCASE